MLRRSLFAATLVLAGCPSPAPAPATPIASDSPGAPVLGAGEPPIAVAPEEEPEPEPPARPSEPQLDADASALLTAHNVVRAGFCAPPLAWSPALATEATAWARSLAAHGCAFEHSNTPHGENLAAGTAGALGPDDAVAMWADEVTAYDFRHPGFGMDTGHFTQVVWKGTTEVGCGTATCKGLTIYVCNYDPPGNVEGEFPANVAPVGCK